MLVFIGEVSKKTQLTVKTIRFYEEKGLIPVPLRQGKYRVYTDDHVEILKLISEAKTLGVTLSELNGLIKFKDSKANWSEISEFLVILKERLTEQINATAAKIAKIDSCISIINQQTPLDSPLNERVYDGQKVAITK